MDDSNLVLITGASTGLGLALSKLLLGTTYRLLLTGRSGSLTRFQQAGITESERVFIRPLDVTSEPQRRALVEEASERWGGVDILVNNAGIAYRAVVEHLTEQAFLDLMSVNCFSPLELIRQILPQMRRKGHGRLINVSSVGGMMAMPTMAFYSASKFALEGATEALWYEVRPWNIKVTLVQPGFIRSESFQKTRYADSGKAAITEPAHPYHAHYAHMDAFIAKLMHKTISTPETVARKILTVMQQEDPPLRVSGTVDASFFSWLRRLLPRAVYHRVLYAGLPRIGEWGEGKHRRNR